MLYRSTEEFPLTADIADGKIYLLLMEHLTEYMESVHSGILSDPRERSAHFSGFLSSKEGFHVYTL
jgi:hypothetical protein